MRRIVNIISKMANHRASRNPCWQPTSQKQELRSWFKDGISGRLYINYTEENENIFYVKLTNEICWLDTNFSTKFSPSFMWRHMHWNLQYGCWWLLQYGRNWLQLKYTKQWTTNSTFRLSVPGWCNAICYIYNIYIYKGNNCMMMSYILIIWK